MLPSPDPAPIALPLPADTRADDWHALPPRGAWLAATGALLGSWMAAAIALGVARLSSPVVLPWRWLVPIAVLAGIAAACIAWRRHRTIRWRLDAHGLAVIRGRLWQSETHVPISRVQHLDVRRGPLERAARLATLVVHTAGTRLSAVSLSGLDHDDAERLRDRLAHQLDQDDDAL